MTTEQTTKPQDRDGVATASGDVLTVTDSRTGQTYELPIEDGTIRAKHLRDIKVDEDLSDQVLRRAMTYGSVMASFNVEQFGTERVQALTHGEINRRFEEFRMMTHLDAQPVELGSAG